MRLYLDKCCWNRPFDDHGQERVRLEAEAVEAILAGAQKGRWELIYSDVVELENDRDPNPERRERVLRLLKRATDYVRHREAGLALIAELNGLGFDATDALHLACALAANADIFLTADDQLQKCWRRNMDRVNISVANPADWLAEINSRSNQDGQHSQNG